MFDYRFERERNQSHKKLDALQSRPQNFKNKLLFLKVNEHVEVNKERF